jgi:adenylylsulfate reductase subunit B
VLGVLLLRQDLPAGRHRSRHYADIVPLGGSVQPMRGSDSIMWTIKFRNGTLKRFKFPIRTTAEGSIDCYGGKPMPKMSDIDRRWRVTRDVMGGFRAGNPAELIRK